MERKISEDLGRPRCLKFRRSHLFLSFFSFFSSGVNGTQIFSSLPNHDYLIRRCLLQSLPRSSSLRLEGSSLFVAGSVHVGGSVTATEVLLDSGAELLVGLRGSRESLRATLQVDESQEDSDARRRDLRRKAEEEKRAKEEKIKENRRGSGGAEDTSGLQAESRATTTRENDVPKRKRRRSIEEEEEEKEEKEEEEAVELPLPPLEERAPEKKERAQQDKRSQAGRKEEAEEEKKSSGEKKKDHRRKKRTNLIFITRTYEPMNEWVSSNSLTLQQAGVAYFDKHRQHSLSIDINCPILDTDGIPFTETNRNSSNDNSSSSSRLPHKRKLTAEQEEKDSLLPQEREDRDTALNDDEEEEEEADYSFSSSSSFAAKRRSHRVQSVGDLNVGRLMGSRSSHVVVYGNAKASVVELSGSSHLNSLCGAFLSDLDSPGMILRDSSIATFSGLGVNLFSNLYTRGSSFFYLTGPAQIAFETQGKIQPIHMQLQLSQ